MFKKLCHYFDENSLLFKKQFGFTAGPSTDHAVLELIDEINEVFNIRQYFLGIFIDLSEAFGTVDHKILLNKLCFYCFFLKLSYKQKNNI